MVVVGVVVLVDSPRLLSAITCEVCALIAYDVVDVSWSPAPCDAGEAASRAVRGLQALGVRGPTAPRPRRPE